MRLFFKTIRILLLVISSAALFLFYNTPRINAATAIPVLMYHYVRDYTYPGDPVGHTLSVSLRDFDAQMNYLQQNGYTPIDLDRAAAIESGRIASPSKPVVLTFDDGTIDFYTNAFPILRKYGFQATSFVITGFVGRPAYLSWDNIREMSNSGLISFESHTISHRSLPTLNHNAIITELTTSKSDLQQHTGKIVNFIAYPYGTTNGVVIDADKKVGYVGGLGTWSGKVYSVTYNMPRIRINGGDSLAVFAKHL